MTPGTPLTGVDPWLTVGPGVAKEEKPRRGPVPAS